MSQFTERASATSSRTSVRATNAGTPRRPAPQAMADDSPRQVAQRRQMTRLNAANERASPRNGLPESLRSGMRALSGVDLGEVQVHYDSPKPAQLQAMAYAQGNDIHLGPGQQRHLAHEAWHLVQQRQGRVKPTAEASGVAINDNPALELEADQMAERAARMKPAQHDTDGGEPENPQGERR